jgi:hypothetical protein
MSLRRLFEVGCDYLKLTFDSSVVPGDWYILPKKYQIPKSTNNAFSFGMLGAQSINEFPQFGYPKDTTFADFIIKMKDVFNGKVLMNQNTGQLRFERRDFSTTPATYQLPPVRNTTYQLNTNEIYSNFFVEFSTDVMESNTITQYGGTSYQVIQTPIAVANSNNYKLLKGFKQVQLPYALGKRKTELTTVEKVFDTLLEGLDLIVNPVVEGLNATIGILNDYIDLANSFFTFIEDVATFTGADFAFDFPNIPTINPIDYTPLGSLIDNRIGMLMLENDFFMQDKLLCLSSDGKMKETQPTGKYLYENFYVIDVINNQWKLQEFDTLPFTLDDYLKVKDNPNAFDENGQNIKLESFIFNPWQETASAKIRKRYIYDANLQQQYIEPNGE